MTQVFDANQHAPKQLGTSHPVGKFPAQIINTSTAPVKDNDKAGMFVVDFVTPAGEITKRYNLWNPSPKAVEIAHGELSALCYATGVFRLNGVDGPNPGAELRGARLMIEVAEQLDKETKQPNGYTQIIKVYDANGNEPGKAPAQAPQPQGQAGNGGWQAPAQQNPAQDAQKATQWPTQDKPNNPAPSGGWSQSTQQTDQKPPWAK